MKFGVCIASCYKDPIWIKVTASLSLHVCYTCPNATVAVGTLSWDLSFHAKGMRNKNKFTELWSEEFCQILLFVAQVRSFFLEWHHHGYSGSNSLIGQSLNWSSNQIHRLLITSQDCYVLDRCLVSCLCFRILVTFLHQLVALGFEVRLSVPKHDSCSSYGQQADANPEYDKGPLNAWKEKKRNLLGDERQPDRKRNKDPQDEIKDQIPTEELPSCLEVNGFS